MSRAHGIRDEELMAIGQYRESGLFAPLDALVLDYATEMSRTPVEVPAAMVRSLSSHFDPAQMVELTASIAWENFRARFNHALHVEADGFSEGAVCAVPERGPADVGSNDAHSR